MNIGEFINYKLNESKYEQVKELLIGLLKNKQITILDSIQYAVMDGDSDTTVINLKKDVEKINQKITALECVPNWFGVIDLEEIAETLSYKDISGKELKLTIAKTLEDYDKELSKKYIDNILKSINRNIITN